MITHKPKPERGLQSAGTQDGEIVTKQIEILEPCRAEIIEVGTDRRAVHLHKTLEPGQRVTAPIWSALDLVSRKKAKFLS